MNGKILNRKWDVNAKHALFRESGDWYHQLRKFPGAFFDKHGYILFNTEEEYRNCPYLQIQQDVHVPNGIFAIPGYIQVVGTDSDQKSSAEPSGEEPNVYYEGKASNVELTRYERNQKARRECLNHYGANCSVCSMNFGKIYGKAGDGLIHVHHLIPVSDIREEYEIDPIQDLRPVCPNCHAVIHRRNPPYTIKEVKLMLY